MVSHHRWLFQRTRYCRHDATRCGSRGNRIQAHCVATWFISAGAVSPPSHHGIYNIRRVSGSRTFQALTRGARHACLTCIWRRGGLALPRQRHICPRSLAHLPACAAATYPCAGLPALKRAASSVSYALADRCAAIYAAIPRASSSGGAALALATYRSAASLLPAVACSGYNATASPPHAAS